MSVSAMWAIAGGILLALEVFGAPGIGFLFGGLAAITVSLAIIAGYVESLIYQFTLFLLAQLYGQPYCGFRFEE